MSWYQDVPVLCAGWMLPQREPHEDNRMVRGTKQAALEPPGLASFVQCCCCCQRTCSTQRPLANMAGAGSQLLLASNGTSIGTGTQSTYCYIMQCSTPTHLSLVYGTVTSDAAPDPHAYSATCGTVSSGCSEYT
jgi:hypothetical protein